MCIFEVMFVQYNRERGNFSPTNLPLTQPICATRVFSPFLATSIPVDSEPKNVRFCLECIITEEFLEVRLKGISKI